MTTFATACSGIESASVALGPLGFTAQWFSEIEAFPCAVLRHHWPHVPNLGDMTSLADMIRAGMAPAPEVFIAGTPCQSFSVAGLREGLEDPRGQLTLAYVRIIDAIDERRGANNECVAVWENVPGVLTSKDNAFGEFLAALCGEDGGLVPTGKGWPRAGYVFGPERSIAWRTLDAQYFGLAQRRKRVFLVASARADFDPAAVLFESEGVRRDSPPSRETGQEITPESSGGSHWDNTGNAHPTLNQSHNTGGIAQSNQELFSQRGGGLVGALDTECGYQQQAFQSVAAGHIVGTITARMFNALGARDVEESALRVASRPIQNATRGKAQNGLGVAGHTDPMYTLDVGSQHGVGRAASGVRKLLPVECERLQGFPDDHTAVPYRNKPASECPDGPRYKAIGNSKAVPVIRWVGARIKAELTK